MCFNTMRYTFNMVTMMKEKVNTHFSFPMKLNMAGYTEECLLNNKDIGGNFFFNVFMTNVVTIYQSVNLQRKLRIKTGV